MKSPGEAFLRYAFAALLIVLLPLPTSAGIKCWTNDEGVRECGDAIPPEHAQKGHREMTETGVTVSTTDRAKTKEELRVLRAEEARLAAIRAEEARKVRQRKLKDRVLLSTFNSEEDLTRAHEGQVAAIDVRIEHTEQILRQLENTLEDLRGQAAKLERSGKAMTPELERQITRVERQLQDSHKFIEKRRLQKAQLAAQFAEDLDRYRELTGVDGSRKN